MAWFRTPKARVVPRFPGPLLRPASRSVQPKALLDRQAVAVKSRPWARPSPHCVDFTDIVDIFLFPRACWPPPLRGVAARSGWWI
eukprot:5555519-Pyramimonas_sp.AAC.2